MSIERSSSTEHQTSLKTASNEEVSQVASQNVEHIKSSKINDILNVLDLTDNEEEFFKQILQILESEVLITLANKSKDDIKALLLKYTENDVIKIENNETQEQNTDLQYIDHKLTQIKQAFPQQILDKHPSIATKLNSLDTINNPTEKDQVLQDILQTLKQP
jgi:carboxypeptidase C (cathepsin A)